MVFAVAEPALDIGSSPRSAHLVFFTPSSEDEGVAPRADLTLPQLQKEELIFADAPSFSHPVLAFVVGGVMIAAGAAGAVAGAVQPCCGDVFPTAGQVAIVSSIAVLLSGAVMATLGACLLDRAVTKRKSYAARVALIRARIAALQTGESERPLVDLERISSLEDQKPFLTLPLLLASSGAASLIIGGVLYATNGRGASDSSRFISIGFLVVGLALESVSMLQLISRIQTRAELDDQIRSLQAPNEDATPAPIPATAGASLPAVPTQLAVGWRF